MVAASSPFGLSRAALDRRIQNQIPRNQVPRKRHTPYSAPKDTVRVIPKHVVRPKPKPKADIPTKNIHTSRVHQSRPRDVHQSRPEKRGTNRTRPVATSSDGVNQWSARRILASRPHPFDASRTLYKVQWETTWEDANNINDLIAAEWKEAVRDGSTFEFKAKDGREWAVLKDATCLENDSEESQWEMWRAIRRNAVSHLEKDWVAGLQEGEFELASEEDAISARSILDGRWSEEVISATNILRATRDQISHEYRLLDTDMSLGSIKIRYVAGNQVWMVPQGDDHNVNRGKGITISVADLFRTLTPNPLQDLDANVFSTGDANLKYYRWCKTLKSLIQKAPFLFKSGTWLQLLAFLLIGSEAFRRELACAGVEVQDDWCQRSREYSMHMYYEQIVDDRATHEIQETFLNLRDFFRDLETNKDIPADSDSGEKVTVPGGDVEEDASVGGMNPDVLT